MLLRCVQPAKRQEKIVFGSWTNPIDFAPARIQFSQAGLAVYKIQGGCNNTLPKPFVILPIIAVVPSMEQSRGVHTWRILHAASHAQMGGMV